MVWGGVGALFGAGETPKQQKTHGAEVQFGGCSYIRAARGTGPRVSVKVVKTEKPVLN